MRTAKGKCPQCQKSIIVDLDAPELRCPFCNALLKKSAKNGANAPATPAPAAGSVDPVVATTPAPQPTYSYVEPTAPAPTPASSPKPDLEEDPGFWEKGLLPEEKPQEENDVLSSEPVAAEEPAPQEEQIPVDSAVSDFLQADKVTTEEEPSAPAAYQPTIEEAPQADALTAEPFYKKPIALAMAIVSAVAALFLLLFSKNWIIGLISEEAYLSYYDAISGLMCENYYLVISGLSTALLAGVCVLGLLGKRYKVGFTLLLVADIVYGAFSLLGGAGYDAIVESEEIAEIIINYGDYIFYGVLALLAASAVFFALDLFGDKENFNAYRPSMIPPLVYMALIVIGSVVLVFLPKMVEDPFVMVDVVSYFTLAAIGLAVLLPLMGVHDARFSRYANGWVLFGIIATVVLINLMTVVIDKVADAESGALSPESVRQALTPLAILFGTIGLSVADLRNN